MNPDNEHSQDPEYRISPRMVVALVVCVFGAISCTTMIQPQDWETSLGPVMPHDSFPADCSLCHVSGDWHKMKPDFSFDHLKETGTPLEGAHADASCILCHNDRGPVAVFAARGCAGCHEDFHQGQLGPNCADCHNESGWRPRDEIAIHDKTSFPLVGAHASLECFLCHAGSEAGQFRGLATTCESCHLDDALAVPFPNHRAANWVSDCRECHVETAWEEARFEHPATFPLRGGHGALTCAACHRGDQGPPPSTQCFTCHIDDYQRTADPNHIQAGIGTNCMECHQPTLWEAASFTHPGTFPLRGGHSGLSCADCHAANMTGPLDTDCAACHFEDFERTTDPNHVASNFPSDCTLCHNTSMWDGAQFMHPASFPLMAGHSGLECAECHTNGIGPQDSACSACHTDDFQATTEPNHSAAGLPLDCTECHNTMAWDPALFMHPTTFPLVAGHGGLDCAACHMGEIGMLPTDCVECHRDDYNEVTEPNHVTAGFPLDCTQCHNTANWEEAMFAHPATFPLAAGHGGLDCAQCHVGSLGPLDTDCIACHDNDYQEATEPNHVAAGFPTDCTECHNIASWEGALFMHSANFPLTNGHSGLDCAECHAGGLDAVPTDCVNCHRANYQQAMEPNHVLAGFSTDCAQCHNTVAWENASFMHSAAFPLTMGHSGLDCFECHQGGLGPLPTNCASCHLTDYQQTNDPNHVQAGFPTDCMQCHNTASWESATFNHPASFPLQGGHGQIDCSACHQGGLGPLPTDCSSCHLDDYQRTRDPNHVQAGFPTDCAQCHDTFAWENAQFMHSAAFPLAGGHGGLDCAECHQGGIGPLPTNCASCHLADYQRTNDPNHVQAGFPTDCMQCHNTNTWEGAEFQHSAAFPLTLGHGGLDCAECHQGGLGPLPTDCVNCHLAEYQSTNDPNHVQAGFPTDCAQCHSPAGWDMANFIHPASFPLAQGHSGLDCAACHQGGLGPLPTNCASCHIADYMQTRDPNHALAGFPTDCMQCHDTAAWDNASFAHPASFPLEGGHGGIDCSACHQGGIGPLPTDCVSCHLMDYQRTNDPNHVQAGFPTDCTQCHGTLAWDTANFMHPASFPLAAGHGGLECSQCHQGGIGPLPTNCSSCHLRDYQQTNNPNHAAAGFPTDCMQCHNTNAWGDATFNHPQSFPLAGGHADLDCSQCHQGGLGMLPTECVTCHLQDYRQAMDPNHALSGFPTDCTQCHNINSWESANFVHPQSFPLTGGHGGGLDCSACHINGIGPLPTDCSSCHLDDYQATTDPDHATSGFPLDCMECHSTISWSTTFVHPASFPLDGGHAALDCSACHQGGLGPLPTDCYTCHAPDYQRVTDPNHVLSGFPTDCTECHTTASWSGANFAHPQSFPLSNGHSGLDCSACHMGGIGPLPTNCISCHLMNYQQTSDPNHVTAGFPTDCMQCHNTLAWESATFSHPASFPLTGSHGGLDCSACHIGGLGALPTNCASCHLADFQQATSPNHVQAGFPTDCTQCHTPTAWENSTFTHSAAFPLNQGHSGLDCAACHQGGLGPLPTNCVACHLSDYQQTNDPNHIASGFPTDCMECHDTSDWGNATFNHPSSFPLAGGHSGVDCTACHIGGLGALPTNCASCHLSDYQQATSPNHAQAGFPTDCTQCHAITTWESSTFTHSASFPLTQAHSGLDCAECHQGGLGPLSTNCVMCHLMAYQGTTDPNHVAAGFPLDCMECHTPTAWQNATFTHPAAFPLTGSHGSIDCSACHQGGLGALPTNCASCHLDDYQATTTPNHVQTGFPTDCAQCHTTTAWLGATFSHPATFPLTSGHGGLDCSACHQGGIGSLPTTCVSCHLAKYQATTNPNHTSAGFSTDCMACHDTTAWENGVFNHRFPITSGAHRNLDCVDCHTTPNMQASFSCTHCHEHRQSKMDSVHRNRNGYVWSSPACLECHPNGRS